MSRGLNKCQFIGHLGSDPEMRYTPQGSAVTTMRIAVGRQWKDRDGNPHEDTEWVQIVAWDKLGEICNQYLSKGARIFVEGRLQTRKWTDRDGVKRYSTEIVAQEMLILDTKRGDAPAADDDELFDDAPPQPAAPRSSGPVKATPRVGGPIARRNEPQPIESDDDIPF